MAFLFVGSSSGVEAPVFLQDARVSQSDAPRRLLDALRLSRHLVRVARSERVLPWCEFEQPGGGCGGRASSGTAAVWHVVFFGCEE